MSLKMSLEKRLRTVLQFGALIGAPMLPQEIQELMRRMNQPKLAHVLPSKVDERGDDPPDE